MTENVTLDKSKKFAIRIVNLYKHLTSEKKEFVLSKKILRSGTSIGANIHEAHVSMSTAEFISKLNISLKEAFETSYWLDLLHDTEYIEDNEYASMSADCIELLKLLTSIIKTTKANQLK